jgi:hypothetical protein
LKKGTLFSMAMPWMTIESLALRFASERARQERAVPLLLAIVVGGERWFREVVAAK